MPIKEFPEELKNLINSGWVRSYPALDIQFADNSYQRLSTVPIQIGSAIYEDKLTKLNSVKATLSRAVDRCEILIDNSDLVMGDSLLTEEADEILQNLPATYSRIYQNIRNPNEKYLIPQMSGIIYTFVEDGETALNLVLISDAYAGGGITQFDVKQSCVWPYKDGFYCTYSGDLPTCDLSFYGSNGCVAHFGMEDAKANFGGGAVDLTETARLDFGILGGGGGGGGGQSCFLGETPIYTDLNYNTEEIKNFTGGSPILGFDKGDLLPKSDQANEDVFSQNYRNWYYLLFSDGSILNVTESHPFFPQPNQRVLVKDFQVGMKFRRNVNGVWREVRLIRKEARHSFEPRTFYNVPVAANHTYYANGFPVSNIKNDPIREYPTPFEY